MPGPITRLAAGKEEKPLPTEVSYDFPMLPKLGPIRNDSEMAAFDKSISEFIDVATKRWEGTYKGKTFRNVDLGRRAIQDEIQAAKWLSSEARSRYENYQAYIESAKLLAPDFAETLMRAAQEKDVLSARMNSGQKTFKVSLLGGGYNG